MSSILLLRLVFDLAAAGLLLFGFSYWWLGNAAHELAGTMMFLLLGVHTIFNRRFYRTLGKTRRDPRSLFNVAVTLALIVAMLGLLVTSVLISHALSGVMSPFAGFTIRQIHTLAAYWALVIVAIHLGLRWPFIMGAARSLFGISGVNPRRTWVLRLVATAIALHGIWSWFALGLGDRLAMRMTLDWWNFEASVAGFFVHAVAVAGLCIVLTYYAMKGVQHLTRTMRNGRVPGDARP